MASWLFDASARGSAAAEGVGAVMLMSGFYHPEAPLPPGPRAYFGTPADASADEGVRTIEALGDILSEAVLASLARERTA